MANNRADRFVWKAGDIEHIDTPTFEKTSETKKRANRFTWGKDDLEILDHDPKVKTPRRPDLKRTFRIDID